MAKGQSKSKNRLMDFVVLGFVIITMALLVAQMGMNVANTLEAEAQTDNQVLEAQATPSPVGPVMPSPTFDISSVTIEN
jgi:hypothetical protein